MSNTCAKPDLCLLRILKVSHNDDICNACKTRNYGPLKLHRSSLICPLRLTDKRAQVSTHGATRTVCTALSKPTTSVDTGCAQAGTSGGQSCYPYRVVNLGSSNQACPATVLSSLSPLNGFNDRWCNVVFMDATEHAARLFAVCQSIGMAPPPVIKARDARRE